MNNFKRYLHTRESSDVLKNLEMNVYILIEKTPPSILSKEDEEKMEDIQEQPITYMEE